MGDSGETLVFSGLGYADYRYIGLSFLDRG